MIQEDPRQLEGARYAIGECFDPTRFCRVMPGVNQINSQFLGQSERVMWPFTGNESIHSLAFCLGQLRSGSSCNNPNPFAAIRSRMTMPDRPAKSLFDSPEQSRVIEIDVSETTHPATL